MIMRRYVNDKYMLKMYNSGLYLNFFSNAIKAILYCYCLGVYQYSIGYQFQATLFRLVAEA